MPESSLIDIRKYRPWNGHGEIVEAFSYDGTREMANEIYRLFNIKGLTLRLITNEDPENYDDIQRYMIVIKECNKCPIMLADYLIIEENGFTKIDCYTFENTYEEVPIEYFNVDEMRKVYS